MAEQSLGRRVVVQDPLAQNVRENLPDRSQQTIGVRPVNAGTPGTNAGLAQGLGRLAAAAGGVLDTLKDDAISQGKMDYLAGTSEAEVIKSGNMYRQQGWKAMSIVDQSNNWFTNETLLLDPTHPNTTAGMQPEEYQARLNQIRAEQAQGIEDPELRKTYIAAWDDKGPRLAAMQVKSFSDYNRIQNNKAFGNMIGSAASTNADSQVQTIGDNVTGLRVSAMQVGESIKYDQNDRDIGIRTMLGEAAWEGPEGLAAVAHVMKNRALDGGYGGTSIAAVALAPKQFSAWNNGAGGNNPSKWSPESRQYKQAGEIYDAVMAGKHVDPTGGATHYYSPEGMQALVAMGAQKNTIPQWFNELNAKTGSTKIGGHIFTGKARLPGIVQEALGPAAGGISAETVAVAAPGADPASVAGAVGVPQGPSSGRASKLQEMILAAPGKREDKVQVLASQMIQNFQNGDPSLFNDAGGYAMLQGLGADTDLINKVQDAERGWKEKQLGKFNVEQEKWEAGILSSVERGEISYENAMDQINTKYQNKQLNDTMAKSLAERVRAADVRSGRETLDNPELLNRMSYLYAAVANGSLSVEDAQAQTEQFAQQFNVPTKKLNQFVSKLAIEHEGRLKRLDAEAQNAQKRAQERANALGAVDRAISTGTGLSALRGSLTMTDENGVERSMSLQEIGVQRIKDDVIADFKAKAPDYNNMYGQNANANLLNDAQVETYARLRAHNVIDEQTSSEYSAAVSGPLVEANGAVNPKALEAADFYLRMSQNGRVGDAYLAKMFDQSTRATFNMIQSNMAGGETIENAIKKTSQALTSPQVNPDAEIDRNSKFYTGLDTKIRTAVDKAVGRDGILAGFFNTEIGGSDVDAVLARNETSVTNWVKDRATRIYATNPGLSEEAAIKTATQELSTHTDVVGGNILLANRLDTKLSTVMGVDSYGPTASQQVITDYLRAQGPKLLSQTAVDAKTLPPEMQAQIKAGTIKQKTLWESISEAQQSTWSDVGSALNPMNIGQGLSGYAPNLPEYFASYSPDTGIVRVQFYKDRTRSELVGPAINIPAKELGERWKTKQQKAQAEGLINQAWHWAATGIAGAVKGISQDLNTDVPNIMSGQ